MLLLASINFLVGALFGVRYRVMILLPLTAIVVPEAILIHVQAETWISTLWKTLVLLACVEIGYLAGTVLGALFPASVREFWNEKVQKQGNTSLHDLCPVSVVSFRDLIRFF
jgi:hypothetical protein